MKQALSPPELARQARTLALAAQQTQSEKALSGLTALCAEGRLGPSTLQYLGVEQGDIQDWLARGFAHPDGEVRPLSIAKFGPVERAYAPTRGLDQLLLRRAQSKGTLGPLTLELEELSPGGSRASLVRRLQSGSLHFRPDARHTVQPEVNEALLRSVLQPFDGAWLQETWKDKTPSLLVHVLHVALAQLRDVRALVSWLDDHPSLGLDPALQPLRIAQRLLCQDGDEMDVHIDRLSTSLQLELRAATHLMRGEPEVALKLIHQALRFEKKKYPSLHPLSPLLAFLLSTDSEQESHDPSKWLAQRGADEANKAAARVLRLLTQTKKDPQTALRRIDAHRAQDHGFAFEELFMALCTHAFVPGEIPRAAWARRLTQKAALWVESGYFWPGRQALVLASSLDRSQMQRALQESNSTIVLGEAALLPQSGDLASLLKPPAPWELSLDALSKIANDEDAETAYRIEWYIDPVAGTVNRPGLLHFERGRGWHLERRLSLEQVSSFVSDLPSDDQQVLARLSHLNLEDDGYHLELFDALIEHPRVVDGTRGAAKVSVKRGECCVVSEEETHHLRIGVRPLGLGPGLNLVRAGQDVLEVIFVSKKMHEISLTLKEDLKVPHESTARVLEVIGGLGHDIPVKSPLLEGSATEPADSTPVVRIAPFSGSFIVEIGVQPFGAQGRFFPLGTGPGLLTLTRGFRRTNTERSFKEEEAKVAELIARCPSLVHSSAESSDTETGQQWILGQAEVLDLLEELKCSNLAFHVDWPQGGALRLAGSASIGSLKGALRADKGWYLVSGSLELDAVTSVALQDLVQQPIIHRGRYLRLPSGDFLRLESKIRSVIGALSGCPRVAGAVQIDRLRLALIKEVLGGAQVEEDPQVKVELDEFKHDLQATFPVPSNLHAELRSYQEEGLHWLCSLAHLGLGACLADDMGVGKTVQIIAFLLTRGEGKNHLVVAPSSVCTNWWRELRRFAPSLDAIEYQPGVELAARLDPGQDETSSPSRVFIASYNQVAEARNGFADHDWDTVVVDEAQYIKNPKTQRALALFQLKAAQRIAATGTPVENHLGDLWGIFRFLNPSLLGSWSAFQTHFVKPVERDQDAAVREVLRRLVRPMVLRRTKDQVLKELPERTTIRHELKFSPDEELRYAYLRRQIHDKLRTPSGKKNNKLEVLAEITKLRRFCCHPRLIFPEAPDDSPKLRGLLPLLDELRENDHRVLVFSQYVDFLAKVRERLDEMAFDYAYLDGSVPKQMRQTEVDRFQEGDVPLFLISLKAGGLGLNLTAADYVVHLDPWWNPAVIAQATDRAHRLGQTRPVTVYEFVVRDSIEQDMLSLHDKKRNLADVLLTGTDQAGRLAPEELVRWFTEALEQQETGGLR